MHEREFDLVTSLVAADRAGYTPSLPPPVAKSFACRQLVAICRNVALIPLIYSLSYRENSDTEQAVCYRLSATNVPCQRGFRRPTWSPVVARASKSVALERDQRSD